MNVVAVLVWNLATKISTALFGNIDGFALFASNVMVEVAILAMLLGVSLTGLVMVLFVREFRKELNKSKAQKSDE